MKIEAVTVCVGYDDFLAETIRHNLPHIDRWVVVTRSSDWRTIAVCRRWGISHIETDVFDEYPGEEFNKGRAINLGLQHLRGTDWILHIDADIALPERTRDMLDRARLDKTCVYGIDRLDCTSPEAWADHQKNNPPQWRDHHIAQPPRPFWLGARIVHWSHGWCPIGFFQLWHKSANKNYPEMTGSAEHSDVLFAVQWPRAKRVLLPELLAVHLTQGESMGANWRGRKTPRWDGAPANDNKAESPKGYGG
jgi:hypothetical protein